MPRRRAFRTRRGRPGSSTDSRPAPHRAARLLGTNTAYLSRAFNQGLGQNFSRAINRLRCEEVADGIASSPGAPILDLALDAGFSSKASFNRAFQDRFGMTPQAMRREARGLKA